MSENHCSRRTKVTRGGLSGPTSLMIAIPLAFLASPWILEALRWGKPIDCVIATIIIFLSGRFLFSWLHYLTGDWEMVFYDENTIAIREKPSRWHMSPLTELKEIVKDGRGYTLCFPDGPRFRLRHKDARPDLRIILNRHHARMGAGA